jgi:hypothetical protein
LRDMVVIVANQLCLECVDMRLIFGIGLLADLAERTHGVCPDGQIERTYPTIGVIL